MTAQLKRFPKRPADSRTPEQQALWVKYDRIGNRLQEIARKADLLAWAIDGLMDHDDTAWPHHDCAHEIRHAVLDLAEEVRL